MDKGIRAQPVYQPMRERDQNSFALLTAGCLGITAFWNNAFFFFFFQDTVVTTSQIVNYFI